MLASRQLRKRAAEKRGAHEYAVQRLVGDIVPNLAGGCRTLLDITRIQSARMDRIEASIR